MAWHQSKFLGNAAVPIRLFLFRHGQSVANTNHQIISGRQVESELTELGERQAKALGQYFREAAVEFDLYFTSSAVRTKRTALLSMEHCDWFCQDSLVISDELLEIDMGSWVGSNRVDTYTPEIIEKITGDPWKFKPNKGESQKEVEERISKYINDIVIPKANSFATRKNVVNIGIFGHCLAFACFLRHVLASHPEMTWKIRSNNTGFMELSYQPQDGWFVEHVNAIPHYKFLSKVVE